MELIKVIHAELPQIQCGRCDTPGCYQYAEQISKGAPHDRCVPGGKETLGKLNKLLNKNLKEVDIDYGPSIPLQIAVIDEDECIGCKKCIDACPVDAISGAANLMHDVIEDLCTGCELCIEPCPVDCISLVETDNKNSRSESQFFYDQTMHLRSNENRKKRMDSMIETNKKIGDDINTKLNNRNINLETNLNNLRIKILNDQLSDYHSLTDKEKEKFIDDNTS